MGRSKGLERRATRSENVATDHFPKRRQATEIIRKIATICDNDELMQHSQTNIQFQFCSKATATFSTMEH